MPPRRSKSRTSALPEDQSSYQDSREHPIQSPPIGTDERMAQLVQTVTQAVLAALKEEEQQPTPIDPLLMQVPQAPPVPLSRTIGSYERALKCGAKTFEGTPDPAVAIDWLASQEKIYDYLHFTNEEKLDCITFLLEGPAQQWWNTVKKRYPKTFVVTWVDFEKEFKGKYVSSSHMDEKRREFLELQQGSMTVDEYEQRFTYLSQFAEEYLPKEEHRCRKFEEGLRLLIKDRVSTHNFTEFRQLVDAARRAERISLLYKKQRDEQQKPFKKRPSGGSWQTGRSNYQSGGGSFYAQSSPNTLQPASKKGRASSYGGGQSMRSEATVSAPAGNIPTCLICGKRHFGRCNKWVSGCYFCGKEGHMMRNCPHKPPMAPIFSTHTQFQSQQESHRPAQFSAPPPQRQFEMGQSSKSPKPEAQQRSREQQAKVFALTPQEATGSCDVVSGLVLQPPGDCSARG